ncbi:MAG: leucine-rich repeat protein [Oscillospiraceae bacterium]|nr:leucine-rich repeat protein [Oscillospiraceae bacterium]
MNTISRVMRRLSSALLSCALLSGSILPMPLSVSAAGGSCGTSAAWDYTDGKLTISGTGAVSNVAWGVYRNSITSVTIEDGITALPAHAFDSCSALKELYMADSVTNMGNYMCNYCSQLTTVRLSQNLTQINTQAFNSCTKLMPFTLPPNLVSIGSTAFYGNLALTELTLPDTVTSIGASAFYGTNIQTVTLSSSLQSIGSKAFGMSCFKSIAIPESVTIIETDAIGKYYDEIKYQNNKMVGTYVGAPGITTIYGKAGSAAQTYANAAGLNFVAIGSSEHSHVWSAWGVTAAVTCTANGKRERTCSGCGVTETETIQATGHQWSSWSVKEAGCETTGERSRICTVCGTGEQEILLANGHNYGDWTVETEASCGVTGSRFRECKDCGKREYQMSAALAHSFGEWITDYPANYNSEGREHRVCSNCGETEYRSIPAMSHSFGEWRVEKAASCTENGTEVRECADCGLKEYREIFAAGHDFSDWIMESSPSCDTSGRNYTECSRCGYREYRDIPAAGHSWGNWQTVREPSIYDAGISERVCSVCGSKQSVAIPKRGSFTVSTMASGQGGSISPYGETLVEAGGSLTIRVSPDAGYHLQSILLDGAETFLLNGELTISDIRENHTVAAVFEKDAPVQTRSCTMISASSKVAAWRTDDTDIANIANYSILAYISENGNAGWQNITESCVCQGMPDLSQEGSAKLTFRYQGGDSAVSAYANSNTITLTVPCHLRGDGDFSRSISSKDALQALQAYTADITGSSEYKLNDIEQRILDVDNSGKVDLRDAMAILIFFTEQMISNQPTWQQVLAQLS